MIMILPVRRIKGDSPGEQHEFYRVSFADQVYDAAAGA